MTDNEIDPGTVVLTALAELRGMSEEAWTEGSVFERAVRLDRAKTLIEMLKQGTYEVELSLIESMEEDEFLVPGVGKLTRKQASSSTWTDRYAGERMREDLATAVASEVALDVATGEVDPMKRNVALAALRVAYEAIPSFSSLKSAGRARLGLKLTDYRKFNDYYTVTLDQGDVR